MDQPETACTLYIEIGCFIALVSRNDGELVIQTHCAIENIQTPGLNIKNIFKIINELRKKQEILRIKSERGQQTKEM